MIDLIGWIGNIFFILGAILIARKNPYGFLNNAIGNAFYLVQAVMLKLSSLSLLSVLLIAINIYGIINWKRKSGENA